MTYSTSMNYLVSIMSGFLFYMLVRLPLNRYTNLRLPLLPDRYRESPKMTFTMAFIYFIGFVIGGSLYFLLLW